MIVLTTLKGEKIAINDALVERIEDVRDTRIVLTTGACYIVSQPLDEVVRRCRFHQAEVQVLAQELRGRALDDVRELRLVPPRDATKSPDSPG